MAKGADLLVGAVLMDNIVYADGRRRENIPGGAGLYALAGAALFSPDPVLVTGTGRDLPQTFGPWLDRNGLSTRGLRFGDDHAPRNILRYIDERTRTETPVYGMAHFAKIEPNKDDLARLIGEARSIYIFRNADQAFWTGILPQIEEHGPIVLWEIALDACSPQELPKVREIARRVDGLSINIEEAAMLFGYQPEVRLIEQLRELGAKVVFLRAGARGSFVITADDTTFLPTLPTEPVDVTGGGNAFGGAALVGLAEGRSPRVAGAMGSVAARFAIAQYGPPELGQGVRDEARVMVDSMLESTEQYA
jgi:sugar/nucleoside kinase (ribokinase family)